MSGDVLLRLGLLPGPHLSAKRPVQLLTSPPSAGRGRLRGSLNAPVNTGDVLAGKYRVARVLGMGGMGVVVLARHLELDEPVALKFLLPQTLGNREIAGRFRREARLAVKLKSEHAARIMDTGTLEDGAPYIVMEYLHGSDLNQLIEKRGALPCADVAEFIIHACDAMA